MSTFLVPTRVSSVTSRLLRLKVVTKIMEGRILCFLRCIVTYTMNADGCLKNAGASSLTVRRGDTDLAAERRDVALAAERRDVALAAERGDVDLAAERGDADLAAERRDEDLAAERGDADLSVERGTDLTVERGGRAGVTISLVAVAESDTLHRVMINITPAVDAKA